MVHRILVFFAGILFVNIAFSQSESPCDCNDLNAFWNGCGGPGSYYNSESAAVSAAQTGDFDATYTFGGSDGDVYLSGGETETFCYSYTTGASENIIGFKNYLGLQTQNGNDNCFTRTYHVYEANCATELSGSFVSSSGFWEYNVEPNTEYRFCVKIKDNNCVGAQIMGTEVYLYAKSSGGGGSGGGGSGGGGSSEPCPELGPLTISGSQINQVGSSEYDIQDGGSVIVGQDGSYNGSYKPGVAFFSCDPGLPFSQAELDNLYDHPCYLGSWYHENGDQTTDNNNGGMSGLGHSTIWIVPYFSLVSHTIGDGSGDACYGDAIQLNYLSEDPQDPSDGDCGSCDNPDCSFYEATSWNNRYAGYDNGSTCDFASQSGGTYTSYYLMTADANGTIGIVQQLSTTGTCNISRTATLYDYAGGSCTGTQRDPDVQMAHYVGSGFNPEWYYLNPGQQYVVKVVTVIGSSSCTYDYGCMVQYPSENPPPPPPCPEDNGFITLDWQEAMSGNTPFIPFAATHSCEDGPQTVWAGPTESTLSTGGSVQQFPGFILNLTLNNNASGSFSIEVNVNGSPFSYYGPRDPGNGATYWGPVAGNNYAVMEPYIPKNANVEIVICDNGNFSSFPYTVYDYASGQLIEDDQADVYSNCHTISFTTANPSLTWTINGSTSNVTNNNDGSMTFDPADLGEGDHTVEYTFNNDAGCNLTVSQTITIEDCGCEPPTVFNGVYVQCGVGEASFDLNSVEADIAPFDYANAEFRWYVDENKFFPIAASDLSAYQSDNATIYVEVDVNGCVADAELQLSLSTLDVNQVNYNVCDNSNTALFDLTSLENEIKNGNQTYIINWFSDESLNFPINNPSQYTSAATTVYAQVENEQGECPVVLEIELTIGSLEANDITASLCAQNGSTVEINLQDYQDQITSVAGVSITWYENENLTGQISNLTNYNASQGVVYAQVAENSGSCTGLGSLSITIGQGPTVFNGVYVECDQGNGTALFDLSSTEMDIAPFDYSNSTFTWYSDADYSSQISGSTYQGASTTLYVEVNSGDCSSYATLELDVEPLAGNGSYTLQSCDDGNGQGSFDLASLANQQFTEDATITWYSNQALTESITNPSNYSSASSTIYAYIETDRCEATVEVLLEVGDIEAVNHSVSKCASSGSNASFNLTEYTSIVNGNTSNIVSWFEDANVSSNAIDNPSSYSSSGSTVYAKIGEGDCYAIAEVTLKVNGSIEANDISVDLEDNGNGQGIVNLDDLNDQISNSGSITYFLDAELNTEITNTSNYLTPATTIYAYVTNAGGCEAIALVLISINGIDEDGNNVGDGSGNGSGDGSGNDGNDGDNSGDGYDFELNDIVIELCGDSDGTALIDLNSYKDSLGVPQGSGLSFFYNADGTNLIENESSFVAYESRIYAKSENSNTASISIFINKVEAISTSITMCDNGNGEATFNLSRVNDVVNGGASTNVNWYKYANLTGWIAEPGAFVSGPTTVYAKVSNGDCVSEAEVTLKIGEITANSTTITLCDDGSGRALFYLNDVADQVNGNSGLEVKWFEDSDGQTQINPEGYLSEDTTVYAQVYANEDCYSALAPIALRVRQLNATATSIASCSGLGKDTRFDLTTLENTINNNSNNKVDWYENVNLDLPINEPEKYQPKTYFNGVAFVYASVCGDVVEIKIILRTGDRLLVDIINDEVLLENGEYYVIETSINDEASFEWSPSNGLDDFQIQEPELVANQNQTYRVEATDSFGCIAIDSISVLVIDNKDNLQPVAEIFSPNGDGQNDILSLNIEGACEIEFKIFDRWGKEIFKTGDITQGWDGLLRDESNAPSDSYKYVAVVFLCGEAEARYFSGEVFLLR